jgi:hypothetical protein
VFNKPEETMLLVSIALTTTMTMRGVSEQRCWLDGFMIMTSLAAEHSANSMCPVIELILFRQSPVKSVRCKPLLSGTCIWYSVKRRKFV